MSDPRPSSTLARFRRVPIAAGAAVCLIGCVVLVGWATDVEVLESIAPGLVVMLPDAAVGFILAGASLVLAGVAPSIRWVGRCARALGAAVLLLGLLSVGERFFGWGFGLDLLLFRRAVLSYPYQPAGRMASNSAVSFLLAGLALTLLDVETRRGRRPAQLFGASALLVAFLALVGYAFGVRELYAFDRAAGMALLTAFSFAMLSTGIVFARPERGSAALVTGDDAGGVLARRLLPAAIIVPVASGWLLLRGLQRQLVSGEWGVALFAVASVAVFVAVVFRAARAARATDLERQAMLRREQTARAEAEAAREQAEKAREQAEAARKQAEAANRAKSDFLAVMSHELRTPLNAIIGYTELMAEGITGPVTSQQRAQHDRVRASARHLLALIDGILTLSRSEAGKEPLHLEAVDVCGLAREAATLVEPAAVAKGLRFVANIPSEPYIVEMDATKVRQIMLNLLSNATKFTERGEVALTLQPEPDRVVLTVRDTGPGIAPEHLERVFEPFWQVEQTLSRRVGGTGLGLSVTRSLATLLGGDVAVRSEPGRGSTFTVWFPTAARHAAPEPDGASATVDVEARV